MVDLLKAEGSADKNLVEKWNNRLKSCQEARINFEKQWHQNLAFYAGRQWIVFTKAPGGGFQYAEQASADKWRVRHTANRVLRIIRTELTKLSKEEPQWYCVPSSTDENDRLAAMAGDSISEYILRTKYFNQKRMEATFWAVICGTSFLKNYYDEAALDVDGSPGRIDFEAVPAFQAYVPNLQVTDVQAEPYFIHARTMDPEAAWSAYQVDLKPETTASTILESRFLTSLGIKQNVNNDTKLCYIKENWVKPCREFPKGAMFVTSEHKVIYVYEPIKDQEVMTPGQNGIPVMPGQLQMPGMPMPTGPGNTPISNPDNAGETQIIGPKSDIEGLPGYQYEYPLSHGRFPFPKIDHIPTGMFYGDSVIKNIIPLQKEYNRTRSIMLEHRNLAGKPQWGYITGSIDPKKFNSKPGLLLAVQLGFDFPKALDQPELPPNVTNELEITTKDMDDASSQYEITKGRTPPGVEAASAIAYLQEENDTTMYHTVASLEAAVQETGIQVLSNVYDFWPTDRIVNMTSKNQFMETRQFKKTDLKPIMDFRVEPGSMAPRSQAAKQAFIIELMKMGAIDSLKALRYLQMNETDKLYDEMMLDVRHVQRENIIMSQGQPLNKIDPKGQPPQQMNPVTGALMPGMGPAYKTDVQRDPMTGEPQTDETGQPVTYNVTVNPFDDHEIHVAEHQAYQKTQEFELLPPEIQQIIQDHVDEHKQEIMKERNAVQTDQAMSELAKTKATPDSQSSSSAPTSPSQSNSAAGQDMNSNGASPVGALNG